MTAAGTIEDQDLLPDENGLDNDGTDAAWTQESGELSSHMERKDDELRQLAAREALQERKCR